MRLRGLDEARASYNRGIALLTNAPEVSRRAQALLPHDHPAIKKMTAVGFSRLQNAVNNMILEVTGGKRHFALTEDWIRELHHFAMDGLLEKPGAYRKKPVGILGCTVDRPNWQEVPALMSDLCRYVNDNWLHRDVVNLCAFIIWRLLWIHPFLDGNGRIARSVAHTVFCIKHRGFLPSQKSLMERITDNRDIYVANLLSAHRIFLQTRNIDDALRPMEQWLRDLLSEQLESASSF